MYLLICNPNKITPDHCETLEWPVSWLVIWHLLTQDTLRRCKKRYKLLFIIPKDNYILHILMLLGILSIAWNIVREDKNDYTTNKNTINENKKTEIDKSLNILNSFELQQHLNEKIASSSSKTATSGSVTLVIAWSPMFCNATSPSGCYINHTEAEKIQIALIFSQNHIKNIWHALGIDTYLDAYIYIVSTHSHTHTRTYTCTESDGSCVYVFVWTVYVHWFNKDQGDLTCAFRFGPWSRYDTK